MRYWTIRLEEPACNAGFVFSRRSFEWNRDPSVFLPKENTSNGNSVARFDKVPDPEDDGTMVRALARFMRSNKSSATR